MKRKFILAALVIIVIAGSVGFYLYSKQRTDVADVRPDVRLTARDLIAAFEKDTAAASRQYIDKVIEVTGTVKSIDTAGAIVMGEDDSLSEVAIGLDSRHKEGLRLLRMGASATVQGICSGYAAGGTDPTDLLSGLGTTVQIWSASVKQKQ